MLRRDCEPTEWQPTLASRRAVHPHLQPCVHACSSGQGNSGVSTAVVSVRQWCKCSSGQHSSGQQSSGVSTPALLPAGNSSSKDSQVIGLRDRGTSAALQPDQPAHHNVSSCTPRSGWHTPSRPNSPRSKTSGKRTVGRSAASNCSFAAANSSDLLTYFLPCSEFIRSCSRFILGLGHLKLSQCSNVLSG